MKMVLEDFLFPGEVIKYQSPSEVKYSGDYFNFYITDQRLLVHKRSGLLFKKDRVIAERLGGIISISYKEKGLISKKGILRVETNVKKMDFEGKAGDMKAIWQELQQFIKRPKMIPTQTILPRGEFCPNCGAKVTAEAKFCSSCGQKLG